MFRDLREYEYSEKSQNKLFLSSQNNDKYYDDFYADLYKENCRTIEKKKNKNKNIKNEISNFKLKQIEATPIQIVNKNKQKSSAKTINNPPELKIQTEDKQSKSKLASMQNNILFPIKRSSSQNKNKNMSVDYGDKNDKSLEIDNKYSLPPINNKSGMEKESNVGSPTANRPKRSKTNIKIPNGLKSAKTKIPPKQENIFKFEANNMLTAKNSEQPENSSFSENDGERKRKSSNCLIKLFKCFG